ncbi:MAG: tRNA sulfurtransferase [Methanopyri archaeon]|nr:tRNA sulfurtransferase [Methanopyri archaeon]
MKRVTVVRPSGEVTAKSPRVRRTLIEALARNLADRFDADARVLGTRVVLDGEHPDAHREFGVAGAAVGFEVKPRVNAVLRAVRRVLKRFPDRVRVDVRVRHEGFSGARLHRSVRKMAEGMGLEPRKRAPRLVVEVRSDTALVAGPEREGPRGLPRGTQGSALCTLSGGFDSPVAAWTMAKRGMSITCLHFFVHEGELEGAEENLTVLRRWIPDVELVVDETHREFLEAAEGALEGRLRRYLCVVCKMRMMERACGWAERLGTDCVVTGDSLGQVASQSVWNLGLEDSVADVPVFRPLIGMNKEEILEIGRRIGLEEKSGDGCPFVPKAPVVKPRRSEAERAYKLALEAFRRG